MTRHGVYYEKDEDNRTWLTLLKHLNINLHIKESVLLCCSNFRVLLKLAGSKSLKILRCRRRQRTFRCFHHSLIEKEIRAIRLCHSRHCVQQQVSPNIVITINFHLRGSTLRFIITVTVIDSENLYSEPIATILIRLLCWPLSIVTN